LSSIPYLEVKDFTDLIVRIGREDRDLDTSNQRMDSYIKELQFIEKKRWELRTLEIVILIFLTSTVIILSILEQKFLTLFFLLLLTTLFSIYIITKEKELKSLNRSLTNEQFKNIEERIRSTSLKERLKEVVLLYRVGRISISQSRLQHKLDKILSLACKLVKADRGSIMLSNEKAGIFVIASSIGIDLDLLKVRPQKIGEGVAGWVLENRTPLILTGKVEDKRFKNFIEKRDDISSSISLPIRLKGKTIGVLNLSYMSGSERTFTERDVRILSLFARYISIAIEQTQLSMGKHFIYPPTLTDR